MPNQEMPSQQAEFVVPPSGGRALSIALALAQILAAAGVVSEHCPARRGAVVMRLTGLGCSAGEAAREVLPALLERLRSEAVEATARHVDARRYGGRMPREQAEATAAAFRADFTEAWGQAVADLVRNLPAPHSNGRFSSDPRDAAATALYELGAAVEHARDLRERSAGRSGRPLRFAPARPLGRRREPYWSVELFLRTDGCGADARIGLLVELLPVLRAELDPVEADGRAAIHTCLTGRQQAVRAAVELLPALLQAAEDSADQAGDVPAYLADFGRAAASRLVSALAELPGAPRDRYQSTPSPATEAVDRLPERLFRAAAERFGARTPLPHAKPLTIHPDTGSPADTGTDGTLTVEVNPGPARSGTKARTCFLTELGQALGIAVTDLGPVEADQVPGSNGLPQPELWRRHLRVAGPQALLAHLVELATVAIEAAEFTAAAAMSRLDPKFDPGANADISRAVSFRMFLIAAARACGRRVAGLPDAPAGHPDHDAAAVADRIDAALRAAAALRDRLAAASGRTPVPHLVIIPCGARKADRVLPAGRLYTGSYHLAARRAADAIAAAEPGTRVIILSALHGLVDPATLLAPYEQRMGRPGSVTAEQLTAQADELGLRHARVTVLAGRAYAEAVKAVWPDARDLLAGAGGLGHQLARLSTLAADPGSARTPV